MKKIRIIFFIFLAYMSISGAGYKGTLPDLSVKKSDIQVKETKKIKNDILPLDKLTIPVRQTAPVDKELVEYNEYMNNIVSQLNRLEEILNGDKSFKNFVAAANVLNLTTENIFSKFKSERFKDTNYALDNINHDVQEIKNYWVKINKNAPYVSYYTTQGAYSGSVLNEQLNKFSKILNFARRDITKKLNNIQ